MSLKLSIIVWKKKLQSKLRFNTRYVPGIEEHERFITDAESLALFGSTLGSEDKQTTLEKKIVLEDGMLFTADNGVTCLVNITPTNDDRVIAIDSGRSFDVGEVVHERTSPDGTIVLELRLGDTRTTVYARSKYRTYVPIEDSDLLKTYDNLEPDALEILECCKLGVALNGDNDSRGVYQFRERESQLIRRVVGSNQVPAIFDDLWESPMEHLIHAGLVSCGEFAHRGQGFYGYTITTNGLRLYKLLEVKSRPPRK